MAEGKAFWLGVGAGVAAALALTCAARYAYIRHIIAGRVAFLLYTCQHACMREWHAAGTNHAAVTACGWSVNADGISSCSSQMATAQRLEATNTLLLQGKTAHAAKLSSAWRMTFWRSTSHAMRSSLAAGARRGSWGPSWLWSALGKITTLCHALRIHALVWRPCMRHCLLQHS